MKRKTPKNKSARHPPNGMSERSDKAMVQHVQDREFIRFVETNPAAEKRISKGPAY